MVISRRGDAPAICLSLTTLPLALGLRLPYGSFADFFVCALNFRISGVNIQNHTVLEIFGGQGEIIKRIEFDFTKFRRKGSTLASTLIAGYCA